MTKTIYCNKDGRGSQAFPVPDNLDDFYQVEVENDFVIPAGYRYDPGSGDFVAKPLSATQVDQVRRAAYNTEVDPLMAEAQIKRAMGEEASADALVEQAIQARAAIQARYPKLA